MASSPITSWQIEGEKVEVVIDFPFLGSKITMDGDCSREIRRSSEAMRLEDSFFIGKLCKPRQCVEKQTHYSAGKGLYSQRYGLPRGHVCL